MSTGPTVEVAKTYATVEITAGGATVTVDVPETTVSITAPGPQGPAGTGADGYILQAYDTTDQLAASTTTAYPILLGTVDISDGITVANNGSSQPTRITFNNDGDYNIQFSIQFQNSSATEANANVWFRKNGTDIPDSNSQVTVPKKHGAGDGSLILAANLIVNAALGDYVELYWQTESTDVSIQTLPAGTTPTTPVTPGVIVTVMVNRYLEVGPAGPGVPTGGTIGQVLSKVSSTNYDTTWSTPGLVFIKEQTITNGVSTVVVTDAFPTRFRSFLVVLDQVGGSIYDSEIRLRVGSATSGYYYGGVRGSFYGAITTTPGSNVGSYHFGYLGTDGHQTATINFSSPNLAARTSFTAQSVGGGYYMGSGGIEATNTVHSTFTLLPGSGSFTGGTITVYGYGK